MKLTILLTAVSLMLAGCARGSGDNSGAAALGIPKVPGSYAVKITRANGDAIVMIAEITSGQFEITEYKFPGGNMSTSTFVKFSGTDVVQGDTHSVTPTYDTCQTLSSPASQLFTIIPVGTDQITLYSWSDGSGQKMEQIGDPALTLTSLGMSSTTEVTDCTVQF